MRRYARFDVQNVLRTVSVLCLLPCGVGLLPRESAFAQEERTLEVRVLDSQGRETAARAWVDVGSERLFEPLGPPSCTPYHRDRSFSCDGHFTIQVPSGNLVVHVEKGKEYLPLDIPLHFTEASHAIDVTLRRWIDLPAEGYYSADMHVHFGQDNPRILRQLALADDVHLIPAFSYWLRGRGEKWMPDWPAGIGVEPIRIDQQHLITRNNIEIERIDSQASPGAAVGATFLFGLSAPVTAETYGEHYPSDTALCRDARRHSPDSVLDSDKPSWAETVVQVALGQMDTIQLCHNHYHREQTIPGGFGMIGPLATGESNTATGDGLFHRTNQLYYRFLNCGFRLGVSGGSAIGVMPVPAGYNRVYAKIDGRLTAQKAWAAIKAGRTFATSGPALILYADGASMGDTLAIDSREKKTIEVAAELRSAQPIESLELISNGLVVQSLDLRGSFPRRQPYGDRSSSSAAPVLKEVLRMDLSAQRSGWLAARALFRAPDGLLRQAHTSPIYLAVDDTPAIDPEDVRYMLRWIDVLMSAARQETRFPTPEAREATLGIYEEAREVYLARLLPEDAGHRIP